MSSSNLSDSDSNSNSTPTSNQTQTNRLLLDPNVSPPPFNSQSLSFEFLSAKKEDELELEALLIEFEELNHEFQIWFMSRIRKEIDLGEEGIRKGCEEIKREEERQDAKRGSLAMFIDNFRNAFRLLAG